MSEYVSSLFEGEEPEPDKADWTPDFEYTPSLFVDPFAGDYDSLDWDTHYMKMYGQDVKLPRLIAMYGSSYTYSGIKHPAVPMPPLLAALRRQEEERLQRPFNSVLCNLYRDGNDSVGWHSDADYPCKGNAWIASVSFGATRRFRIRHKKSRDTHHFDLTHGSLIVMKDEAQYDWEHCVPKVGRIVPKRLNLTFRNIVE